MLVFVEALGEHVGDVQEEAGDEYEHDEHLTPGPEPQAGEPTSGGPVNHFVLPGLDQRPAEYEAIS